MFSLGCTPNRAVVDPGDEVRLDIFIYGEHQVDSSRLIVHLPRELPAGQVSVTSFAFGSGPGLPVARPMLPPQKNEAGHMFVLQLNKHYFEQDERGSIHAESPIAGPEGEWAPVTVSFRVSKTAAPGPQLIDLRFVYRAENASDVASATAQITVRSFPERHSAAIAGALTLGVFVAPLIVGVFKDGFARSLAVSFTAAVLALLVLLLFRR